MIKFMDKRLDLLVFLAIPMLTFAGCGYLESLAEGAAATMPDPSAIGVDPASGGISALTFWATWVSSLIGHEVRKFFRKKRGRADETDNRD